MSTTWEPRSPGVLQLPSGRLFRGRGLAKTLPEGPRPDFALYLLGHEPPTVTWTNRWLHWPDFGLPTDRKAAAEAFWEAWERAETERVEIACEGGHGRTGTSLSCLAVLDGMPAREAVSFVRYNYDHNAVETPWQQRYVTRFADQVRS